MLVCASVMGLFPIMKNGLFDLIHKRTFRLELLVGILLLVGLLMGRFLEVALIALLLLMGKFHAPQFFMEGLITSMHDVARDNIVAKELGGAHPCRESRFDQFIDRYWAFSNPLTCVMLIVLAWFEGETTPPGMYLALAAGVLSGYPIVRNSIVSTLTSKRLNAEVLVTCALIASIWVGEYLAAAIVVLMMNIGELLEDITIAKTGEAVRALMELESDTARVIRNGRELEIDIEEVRVGDIVLVKSGEKIPIDGRIKEGRGEINQAPITGESALITKEPGDEVFGTLNQLGVLKVEERGLLQRRFDQRS